MFKLILYVYLTKDNFSQTNPIFHLNENIVLQAIHCYNLFSVDLNKIILQRVMFCIHFEGAFFSKTKL